MYRYIHDHWASWFPLLPSYQAFNARLNKLCDGFAVLLVDFFGMASAVPGRPKVLLGDSMPIITCSHKRDGKVARDLTDKGYCATKKLHYYGVKLHVLGLKRDCTTPFPQYVEVTPASVHDLAALREVLENIDSDACILDKAYADASLEKQMSDNQNSLLTPVKSRPGWQAILRSRDQAFNDLYNKAISAARQPIESLFNWINEHTQIQNASKVRSSNGLKLHLYGKMAAALMMMTTFNS